MDSMDWFTPFPLSTPLPTPSPTHTLPSEMDASPEAALEHLKSELDYQVLEMRRVLKPGKGEVYYRSAGKRPWYNQR